MKPTTDTDGSGAPAAEPARPVVGYFGSRCNQLEQRVGYGLAAFGVVLSLAGRLPAVFDQSAKDHSTALPLALAGVATSVLLGLAVRHGRRVLAAFAAILPGYFIVPSRSALAYAQFLFLAYAAWLMIRASNEASRSAAERRKQAGPRKTAAERAAERRAARSGAAVQKARATPKPSKRYTPPKPQKRRPAPPPADKADKGDKAEKRKAREPDTADG